MPTLSAKTGAIIDRPPEPTAEELLAAKRNAASVERAVFARTCAAGGVITWAEATAWAAMQSLPTVAQTYIDSLPAETREEATFVLLTSPRVWRLDPNVQALAALIGITDEQVDALFSIT